MLEAAPARDASGSLKVQMLTLKTNPDKSTTYTKEIHIQTAGYAMAPLDQFPYSGNLKYWIGVLKSSLDEAYVNKPNADMGLCHIMRTMYLFGTLPADFGSDADLTWRKRGVPDDAFATFFDLKRAIPSSKTIPTYSSVFRKRKASCARLARRIRLASAQSSRPCSRRSRRNWSGRRCTPSSSGLTSLHK